MKVSLINGNLTVVIKVLAKALFPVIYHLLYFIVNL